MTSFKLLTILVLLINISMISTSSRCKTDNCRQCIKQLFKDEFEKDRKLVEDFCVKNDNAMIQFSGIEGLTTNEVKVRVYNLSDKLGEVFANGTKISKEDGIYKSIVVFNKEYNLLPSMGFISQNDPAESPLGTPVQVIDLGTTKVSEDEFIEYLEGLDLENFKDENFEQHLNDILNFLLSN